MTVLNRDQSASRAVGETRGTHARAARRRVPAVLLGGLLIIAAATGFAVSARASSSPSGSMGLGSPGRMATAPMSGPRRIGSGHTQAFASSRRFRLEDAFRHAHEFRRFHGHERGDFANGFFPFGFWPGFGWPVAQQDLAAADDTGGMDSGPPFFWPQVERYQPPTVEKTPSGVTIIRGPGSSHRAWP